MPDRAPGAPDRILPIVLWPDSRLSRPCDPVGTPDAATRALAADMLATMYAAPGRGLAGPQVGVLRRIFVMDAGWKQGSPDPLVVLDPEIAPDGTATEPGEEGCLSIPGAPAIVTRPAAITLRFTALDGTRDERHLTGTAARIAQHEADHLDGLLILDRIDAQARAALAPALARLSP